MLLELDSLNAQNSPFVQLGQEGLEPLILNELVTSTD